MMLNPEIMNFISFGGRGEGGGGELKVILRLWSIYQFIFWYEIYPSQRPLQLDSLEGFLTRSVMSFIYEMPVAFFLQSVPSISTDYVWVVEGLLYD